MKRFLAVLLAVGLIGCGSGLGPVLSSVDAVARALCAAHYGEKQGMSVEDAARAYCATREAWQPWIGPALQAQKAGAKAAASKD